MAPALELRGVSKTYRGTGGDLPVLTGATLEVGAGEFVTVRGSSGCGKTTLLLAAGGLLAPDGGAVLVDGEDVYALGGERRSRLRASTIGFVFQQFHLIPYLSVLENVLAPSLAHRTALAGTRARELVERFGLEGRSAHLPAALSTGERQRTALARALLNRPKLLLADEPTGNLDPESAQVVVDSLAEFARSGGAVLMVTHDPKGTERAARALGLEEGRLR